MPVEWTGSGPGLLLRLDRDSSEPLRRQLEGQVRAMVRDGRLAAGEKLPSSRVLARDLGVSRGLVTEAYAQLCAEGYLVARDGSATRVGAQTVRPPATTAAPATRPPPRHDFRPGVPDLAAFPREDWARAVRRACRALPTGDLGYGDPAGSPVLRAVVAAYLGRVRGAAADPAATVVCAGFAQGLLLTFRALAAQGVRTVAVEHPGDTDQRHTARRAGLDVVPVRVDGDGLDTAALAATAARAVVVTAAHQTPTGGVLAATRRRELVAWAGARDATIVEDDYDAEFRYDREPVGCLQGLAPDRVVLLGSVSKSLAPALRLGWVVAPPALAAAVAREKEHADRGSPTLDELALADLMRGGTYDRHLRHLRARYAERRAVVVAALRRHAPHLRLEGLAAGFHGLLALPDGVEEAAVVAAAGERSVALRGLGDFRNGDAPLPAALVLGFGNVATSSVDAGIATIADLLRAP